MSFTEDISMGLLADAPNYAGMAKRSEARRKGVINLGLEQLKAIFEGGTANFFPLAKKEGVKFDPKKTYYYQDKNGNFVPYWAPKSPGVKGKHPKGQFKESIVGSALGSGGFDLGAMLGAKALGLNKLFGKDISPREIAAKKFRRGILLGAPEQKTFTGFDDSFFDARAKDYTDFALPQVADQYNAAKKAQTFGLSNRGLLDSSIATSAKGELEKVTGGARATVANNAINMANKLKSDVARSRQQAIEMLYQTADPAQASANAVNMASQFSMPNTFAPIVDMFGNIGRRYAMNRQINNFGSSGGDSSGEDDNEISSMLSPIDS